VALPFGLIINEKEGLVLLDRTAKRATELIQVELFSLGGKKAASIQLGVAEKLK